jgi:hypothetical protein
MRSLGFKVICLDQPFELLDFRLLHFDELVQASDGGIPTLSKPRIAACWVRSNLPPLPECPNSLS